jgi:hypothetical protein
VEPQRAVELWREFASSTIVTWVGQTRPWADHIGGNGYVDEEGLIQPVVFPRFAESLLGFTVGQTLAPERFDPSGKPDFTPADAVTHPFVFETKSTSFGLGTPNLEQIDRYLLEGAPRIRRVVQTNLVGLAVFELDQTGARVLTRQVHLRGLLHGPLDVVASTGDARRLADFLEEFRFQDLTRPEKLARVRQAPPWNPLFEASNPAWLSARLDKVVEVLTADVRRQVEAGVLTDPTYVNAADAAAITDELRELEWRLSADPPDPNERTLAEYLASPVTSVPGKALLQYEAHVAYFAATRLLLVRTWEDLGLLEPLLYDGGFDDWMNRLMDAVDEVVARSFAHAENRYPSLFDQNNTYTWFKPTADAYSDAIYELANTYFGAIESDVLGAVYERLLERVDRKLLGQYYTPRDVIRLIWELIDANALADAVEAEGAHLRVLDIATGSGGFLVDVARLLRERYEGQRQAGAGLREPQWFAAMASHLVGVELQRFSAYLAELNLLIQISLLQTPPPAPRIPAVGVLHHDTLSLHNPDQLPAMQPVGQVARPLLNPDDAVRAEALLSTVDPAAANTWFDAAVGNPPYVGEKKLGGTLTRTRERYPYWERFVASHMDYLYWFLILGVSKLRAGGRFGFITTEYWLRATGAAPLRQYLSTRCRIERLIVFRDLRLFPDAQGQHSMVVIGERVAPVDAEVGNAPVPQSRPRVSIYRGPNVRDRREILGAMARGRTAFNVESFASSVSPNTLGGGSWGEVLLTAEQTARRARLRDIATPIVFRMEEGAITGIDRLQPTAEGNMTAAQMAAVGGPGRRPGVFSLTPAEVTGLGQLNAAETSVIRRVVNTRDVFPYAAILAPDAFAIINLPRPEQAGLQGMPPAAVRDLAFPVGLPSLERHLRTFEQVLRAKVVGYDERRPWWSIHRARPGIAAREGEHAAWADYAVTSRWGSGGKLLVGLAPRRSMPASGLHAVMPAAPVSAAYMVGLMNATAVQDIAESLPPGLLRQEDLTALGLPFIEGDVGEEIAALAVQQADEVVSLVRIHGGRWPKLRDALREDVALGTVVDDSWVPQPGHVTTWGTVRSVPWVEVEAVANLGTRPVASVAVENTLFGLAVELRDDRERVLRLRVAGGDESLVEAVAAVAEGLRTQQSTLTSVLDAPIPTNATLLVEQLQVHRMALSEAIGRYRVRRARIDEIVDALL